MRLPVWPVQNGLLCLLLDLLRLKDVANWVETKFGGRVCPMSLDPSFTDPFILCVHHRHSFTPWDPIRPIFRLLLPDGFPAHPHRGFETATYILQGGLRHRDSEGLKQEYTDGCVQWMTAGQGVLHEEMWLTDRVQHELYQIWVNLPRRSKMCQPRIQMLAGYEQHEGGTTKGNEKDEADTAYNSKVRSSSVGSMPTSSLGAIPVLRTSTGASVAIICGSYEEESPEAGRKASPIVTDAEDVRVLHVRIPAGHSALRRQGKSSPTPFTKASTSSFSIIDTVSDAITSLQRGGTREAKKANGDSGGGSEDEVPYFSLVLPDSHMCLIYAREGDASIQQSSSGECTDLPMHGMARFASQAQSSTSESVVKIFAKSGSTDEVDLLLMAGQPSGEPVVAQGAMVMNTESEVNKAYGDYQRGMFGIPWDHSLPDEEWLRQVRQAKARRGG